MNARRFYLIGFLLSVSIISYYQMKECHRLPWPPRIIYTGLAFVAIDLASMFNEEIAGVVAIGLVIALWLNKEWSADCSAYTTEATSQPATTASLTGATVGTGATAEPPVWDNFT